MMHESLGIRSSLHLEDHRRMERARRFRSEPDHGTKRSSHRNPERSDELIEINRHRAEAEQKAAEAHIQEAISEPIIEPSSAVGEVARERKTLWAIATPNSLTIKVVYQPQT